MVAAVLAALLAVPGPSAPPDSPVVLVRILDVSDARIGGDAILITDSAGGRARHVLIDASDHGPTVVRWLERFRVDTLALLLLSHPHADHYGGMPDVVERFPVRAFALAGTPHSAVTYRSLLARIARLPIRVLVADSGTRRVVVATADDSLVLTLLAPPPGCRALDPHSSGDGVNNCSVGARLERDGFAMFFQGDAETGETDWWTRTAASLLRADVLKVGHHGSSNAISPQWLDAVRPRAAVISANGRQHPFAAVLGLLAGRGVPTYCTADAGTITIRVPRGGGWTVTTERAGACRPREQDRQP